MSMVYCYEKLVELRAGELEREARLEALRAEARRASTAGRPRWPQGWITSLRGALPTGIASFTVPLARSTTETSFESSLDT
jgi:hypothetical protein